MSDFFIHQTSILDKDARIGKKTKIWHFSHVMSGAVVGEGCSLGQNVFLGVGVKIGNYCKIQNNVSIYEGVELEDYVFCGPSMVFTNVINPRCRFPRNRVKDFMRTLVKRGASIGANATIVCGITIGENAFIAAGSVVTKDVPPFALIQGVPGRLVGWMSAYGSRLLFDDQGFAVDEIGHKYRRISPMQVVCLDPLPGDPQINGVPDES